MKVKIINKECINHEGNCTCCKYDFENKVFDAERDKTISYFFRVYGDGFPDGYCLLYRHNLEVIEVFGDTCVMDKIVSENYWECDECPLEKICKKLNEMGV